MGGKYVGNWGHLGCELKGVVSYGMAPNRLRAYAGLSKAATYTFTRRIRGFGYAIVGLAPWYLAYGYFADQVVKSTRKNPNDGYSRTKGY